MLGLLYASRAFKGVVWGLKIEVHPDERSAAPWAHLNAQLGELGLTAIAIGRILQICEERYDSVIGLAVDHSIIVERLAVDAAVGVCLVGSTGT